MTAAELATDPTRAEDAALRREIVTPEGVPLVFHVARAGDRAAAFLLDLLILAAAVVVVRFAALFLFGSGESALLYAFLLLVLFLLRNFYFIYFELRWQGRTPGKRLVGIRVIDRGGGALRSDAIFVRNLTRELETYIPVILLLSPEALFSSDSGWLSFLAMLWLAVMSFLPLFNRDRLRVGDLLAGTLVVKAPKPALLEDVATTVTEKPSAPDEITFTREQLGLYGVFELQVLEEFLREKHRDAADERLVAKKIQRKIRWKRRGVPPREFLTAFYRAQRARLEQDLLLGKAREKKRSGRLGDQSTR